VEKINGDFVSSGERKQKKEIFLIYLKKVKT